jgi:heparin binding hemagglutinin HbhA
MPTQTSTTRIPAPLYAAAGAGDLAYEQLRKLPGKVAELRDRAAELRPTVGEAVSETNLRADLAKLRKAARRNAFALMSGAATVYGDLVARGEKVVRSGTRGTKARVEVAPAAGTLTAQVTTAPERPARKAPARSTTARKTTAKRAPAKRTPAKRTPTKA